MNGFGRFGSVVLAILVPVLALFVEGPLQYMGLFYEITRAAASVICIASSSIRGFGSVGTAEAHGNSLLGLRCHPYRCSALPGLA